MFPYISCASSLVLTHGGKKSYYSHPSFSLLSRTIFFLPKACADCFCCHLWFCATNSFLLLSDLFRRHAALRGQRSTVAVSLNFLQRPSKASKSGQTFVICDVCIVVVSRCSLISSGSQMLLLLGSQTSHKHQSRSRKCINMVLHSSSPSGSWFCFAVVQARMCKRFQLHCEITLKSCIIRTKLQSTSR